jgi:hypothetical protein
VSCGTRGCERLLRGIASDARRLARPKVRNFRRWPILGRYVWPTRGPADRPYRPSWPAEVAYLRRSLAARIAWMDRAVPARAPRGG